MPEDTVRLKTIEGVEVFSAGKWNNDIYTVEDLDEMVRAFTETNDRVKPHLKLGHNGNQDILKADGLPAAGWVGKLYRNGEKLLADFIDIPDKIYRLLKNKAYRKVSSEIYWNINFGGKKFKRMLSAVALLGSDMPAVTNLNDILALYGIMDYDNIKNYANDFEVKEYNIIQGEESMDENKEEVKEEVVEVEQIVETKEEVVEVVPEEVIEVVVEEEKKELTENEEMIILKKDYSAMESELSELKEYKAKLEAEKKAIEDDAFINSLEISKAMRPYVIELLGEEKKVYSINEKQLSKKEIITELFSLKKFSDVNLEENSEEGKKQLVDSEEEQIAKIQKYANEKCNGNFGKAYEIILSKNNEDLEKDQGV